MKKSDATHPAEVLSALLGGLDATLPGTRPDLADEATAFAEHLSPLLTRLPEATPPDGLFDAIEAEFLGLESSPAKPSGRNYNDHEWLPIEILRSPPHRFAQACTTPRRAHHSAVVPQASIPRDGDSLSRPGPR